MPISGEEAGNPAAQLALPDISFSAWGGRGLGLPFPCLPSWGTGRAGRRLQWGQGLWEVRVWPGQMRPGPEEAL